MSSRARAWLVVPTALLLGLALTTVGLPAAQAGAAKSSTVTSSISPGQATVGEAQSFSLKFTVGATSSNSLGSVQIVVPASFTAVTPGPATIPSGWVYSLPSCSSDSPNGCGAPGTTLVQVSTPSNNGAQKVNPGQSLTVAVSATPNAKGAQTWNVAAKNSAAWSTGQILSLQGGSPVVTVYGAPAQLSFSSVPTGTRDIDSFGASVQLLDADGAPTPSAAPVSLAAPGLIGTTTVSAVGGTATFSGLNLTQTGDVTLTASSGTLTSATAIVHVTPGPPESITITGPGSSVGAGTSITVGAAVADHYGNPVNPVSTTFAVDGSTVATQTTVNGAVSFNTKAPTSPGGHYVTVTAGTVTSRVDFTVVAGPPAVLTIDSVTDESGAGVLTKNSPFDVVVTARDGYGNPTAYTGTVSLTSSGGAGNSLGQLAGTTSVTFSGQATAVAVGTTYTGYGNGVTLTASASPLTPGTSSIDVALFATAQNSAPGQNTTVNNAACTDATPQVPTCSTLILPNGANGKITLSQGACNPFLTCLTGSQNQALLVDAKANLTDPATGKPLYTRNSPATVQLRCDKTLCGGGGTNSFPIAFEPTGSGTFQIAPACPSKGRIGANQTFCQDFTQNHRDNAGDLVAYVLFLDDLKTTHG